MNPYRSTTGYVYVDGLQVFVSRSFEEEPYTWCAQYVLYSPHRREMRSCSRTYRDLMKVVRRDLQQSRRLMSAVANPAGTRDCGGWDPNAEGGWDQCDPKTIPAARKRMMRRAKSSRALENPLSQNVKTQIAVPVFMLLGMLINGQISKSLPYNTNRSFNDSIALAIVPGMLLGAVAGYLISKTSVATPALAIGAVADVAMGIQLYEQHKATQASTT